jgi:hypothetical protein
MLIRTQTNRPAERKAVILLVVISLLTLFAIIALSFLLYANAEANASKLFREGEANDIGAVGVSAEKMLNFFLKQFIYDVPDDATGYYSALRGHSLARGIYGWNYGNSNLIAYNGTGRLHTNGPGTFMNPFNIDDYLLPNYTFFPGDTIPFIRDPERFNQFTAPLAALPTLPRGIYTGGANAPYTYPDLNNMFLAAVKTDGTVLMPSFFRPYTPFGPAFMDPVTPNPNWSDNTSPAWQSWKYMVLRPRPGDNPGFPLPEDGGGDVKNLPASWSQGTLIPGTNPPQYWNNDSFWMDLGAPVMTGKNGKKFKPLFAPLILDLDGRINLNTAGNVRLNASSTTLPHLHASNQGWGPWEVDLSQVLNNNPATSLQPEWTNVFLGDQSQTYWGRYGQPGYPGGGFAQATGDGVTPHFYGLVDFDGDNETSGYGYSSQINLPAGGTTYSSFPTYTAGYGNNVQPPTPPTFPPVPPLTTDYAANPFEGYLHPLLYNYFQPSQAGTSSNLAFPPSNMEALLRYNDVNPTGATSDLMRLLPNNLQGTTQHPLSLMANPNTGSLIRNMVTTHSFDVDSPGIMPWAIPPGGAGANYVVNTPPPALPAAPSGPAAGFPSLATRTSPQFNNGEFQGLDWRAVNAALGKINLNRKLTAYQTYNALPSPSWTTTPAQVNQATIDRMQFAADIFIRLITVTGVYDLYNNSGPLPPAITSQQQFDALRWLAQLSANIVDFIDSDDIMTPFPWALVTIPGGGGPNPAYQNYPQFMAAINQFQTAWLPPGGTMDTVGQGWVFGTELPRVVINEAYAEYKVTGGNAAATQVNLQVDVWAELHNPFNQDQVTAGATTIPADPTMNGPVPAPGAADLAGANGTYQLLLTTAIGTDVTPAAPAVNTGSLRQGLGSSNVIGIISNASSVYQQAPPGTGACQTTFTAGTLIPPCGGLASTGYLLVQPTGSKAQASFPTPMGGLTFPTSAMSYQLNNVTGNGIAGNPQPASPPATPTIVLQRLANPLLAANPTPGAGYNPYVTVDYMEGGNNGASTGPPNPIINWQVFANGAGTSSYGRGEPYGAYATIVQAQTGPNGSGTNTSPYNSFFQFNVPTGVPSGTAFHWPVHLDRQLVSPMELLQVSAYKPHELTQQFLFTGTLPGVPNYQHRAAWFDEDITPPGSASHYLYRLFDFIETGNRMTGMAPGGRIPGKVNINTIYDQEILQALAAPQPPPPLGPATPTNYFDPTAVQTIFNQLMAIRSPGLAGGDGLLHPSGNSGVMPPVPNPDNPFLSLATGFTAAASDAQNPAGISINNSLMRSINGMPAQPPLFQVDSAGTGPTKGHPYLQDQLFSKIFNNLTTRSNVFALWLTVGFFEVTDSTTRPVKLGAEIGKNENRQVRHKMFAIIDRSSLATEFDNPTVISPPPAFVSGTAFWTTPTYGTPGNPLPTAPGTMIPLPTGSPASAANPSISIPGATPYTGGTTAATGIPATLLSGTYDGISWGSYNPTFGVSGIQAYQPSPAGFPTMGTNLLIDMGSNQELVNVVGIDWPAPTGSPMGASPPPRVYLAVPPQVPNALMAHTGPLAVTPVNTITAWATAIAPGATVTAPIPVSAVSGSFQGVQWSLQGSTATQAGTTVMIDIGTNTEPGIVQQIIPPAGPGQPYSVILQSKTPAGFQKPHGPWAGLGAYTLSYPIPTLGNPGPQANLNIRQIPWVVRYMSIIN